MIFEKYLSNSRETPRQSLKRSAQRLTDKLSEIIFSPARVLFVTVAHVPQLKSFNPTAVELDERVALSEHKSLLVSRLHKS